MKTYIIQAFDSNSEAEEYINRMHGEGYECISISDTNRCITVLLRYKWSFLE